MRSIARLLFAPVALVVLSLVATVSHAQGLPGGFASSDEFIVGAWKWERIEPRQTVWMWFERGGAFRFHNVTLDLEHWGTYTASGKTLHLTLTRTCEKQRANCENRNPPKALDYQFEPIEADVFMAGSERWKRQPK